VSSESLEAARPAAAPPAPPPAPLLAPAPPAAARPRTRTLDLVLDARGLWHAGRCHLDLATWAAAESPPPRSRLRLHLAGELLHEWPCDPALPLVDDKARMAWARRLQVQYHGQAASQWPLAVWAGRGQGVTGWASSMAVDGNAVRHWREQARKLGLQLASIAPCWRAALLYARGANPALARAPSASVLLAEGSLVTVIELDRGKARRVTRRRLGAPSVEALRQFYWALPAAQRGLCVALGSGLEPAAPGLRCPDRLDELGELGAPLPWRIPPGLDPTARIGLVHGPDFLRPVHQTGPWPWLAAATAACLCAVVLQQAAALHQQRQSLLPGQAPVAQAPAGLAIAHRLPPHPRAAWLAHPWQDVLMGLERSTGDHVQWDSLQADVQGRMQAQGRLGSDGEARELAQRLRTQPGWQPVQLARSEAGPRGWRFELLVQRPAAVRAAPAVRPVSAGPVGPLHLATAAPGADR
jgi:hypothetical protein